MGAALDGVTDKNDGSDRRLVGLWGCGTLCATACINFHQSVRDEGRQAAKLDSVIVDDPLGDQRLMTDGFTWLTECLMVVAAKAVEFGQIPHSFKFNHG